MSKRGIYFIGDPEEGKKLAELFVPLAAELETGSVRDLLSLRDGRGPALVILDVDSPGWRRSKAKLTGTIEAVRKRGAKVAVISSRDGREWIFQIAGTGADEQVLRPYNDRELILKVHALLERKKRVCCLGGGTGLFTLLSGLKSMPDVLLTSIVNMSDDGGSSGRLRATFGILPPGDIRRSLVALSNAPEMMNEVMKFRFGRGGELKGHSFGNLFLTALTEIKGSMAEAVRTMGDILNVRGIVLPITTRLTHLMARLENGTVIRGESRVGAVKVRSPGLRIEEVWHLPEAECDPNAFAAILHADAVLIGPGDLFTSVITNLVIKGVRDALWATKAKKIYVCNLMTKPGETDGLSVRDHVWKIVENMGGDLLDCVIASSTEFSKKARAAYAKLRQYPVPEEDTRGIRRMTRAKIVRADVANEKVLVRHDPEKLRSCVASVLRAL